MKTKIFGILASTMISLTALADYNPYPGSGGGTSVHGELTGREAADSHPVTAITGLQDELDSKVTTTDVLLLDNTTEFTPDADYEPATKKYVDDNAGVSLENLADTETGVAVTGDITVSNSVTVAGTSEFNNTVDINANTLLDGTFIQEFGDNAEGFLMKRSSVDKGLLLQLQTTGDNAEFIGYDGEDYNGISFRSKSGDPQLIICEDGIGINTESVEKYLTVDGHILGKKVYVAPSNAVSNEIVINHSFSSEYSGCFNGIMNHDPSRGAFHALCYGNYSPITQAKKYGMIICSQPGSVPSIAYPLQKNEVCAGLGFAGQSDNSEGNGMELSSAIIPRVDGTVSSGVVPMALDVFTSETNQNGLTKRMSIASSGLITLHNNTRYANTTDMGENPEDLASKHYVDINVAEEQFDNTFIVTDSATLTTTLTTITANTNEEKAKIIIATPAGTIAEVSALWNIENKEILFEGSPDWTFISTSGSYSDKIKNAYSNQLKFVNGGSFNISNCKIRFGKDLFTRLNQTTPSLAIKTAVDSTAENTVIFESGSLTEQYGADKFILHASIGDLFVYMNEGCHIRNMTDNCFVTNNDINDPSICYLTIAGTSEGPTARASHSGNITYVEVLNTANVSPLNDDADYCWSDYNDDGDLFIAISSPNCSTKSLINTYWEMPNFYNVQWQSTIEAEKKFNVRIDNADVLSIDDSNEMLLQASILINGGLKYYNDINNYVMPSSSGIEISWSAGDALFLDSAAEIDNDGFYVYNPLTVSNTAAYSNTSDMGSNDAAFASKYYVDNVASSGSTYIVENEVTLYVRPDGDDDNDGSANDSSHAFLTIQKGIDAACSKFYANGVTLHISDGIYNITETINIDHPWAVNLTIEGDYTEISSITNSLGCTGTSGARVITQTVTTGEASATNSGDVIANYGVNGTDCAMLNGGWKITSVGSDSITYTSSYPDGNSCNGDTPTSGTSTILHSVINKTADCSTALNIKTNIKGLKYLGFTGTAYDSGSAILMVNCSLADADINNLGITSFYYGLRLTASVFQNTTAYICIGNCNVTANAVTQSTLYLKNSAFCAQNSCFQAYRGSTVIIGDSKYKSASSVSSPADGVIGNDNSIVNY